MALYKEDFVRIDLADGSIFRSFLNRTLGEGDIDATRFGVIVARGGEPADLTGVSCSGYFVRADGQTVVISGTVADNTAYITIPQSACAVEGNFSLAIKLVGGGVTGTMRIVDGTVSSTTTDTVVDPGHVIPSIAELLAQIEACEDATDAATAAAASALGNFAPAFAQGTANAAGTYVTYTDGKVYLLPDGHTVNTTWANTTKTAVTVGGEIVSVKGSVDDLKSALAESAEAAEPVRLGTWSGGSVADGVFSATYSGSGNKPAAVCYMNFWKKQYRDAGLVTRLFLSFHVDSDISSPGFTIYPWVDGSLKSISASWPGTYDPTTKICTIDLTDAFVELASRYTGNYYTVLVQPDFSGYSSIQLSGFKFFHLPIDQSTVNQLVAEVATGFPSLPSRILGDTTDVWGSFAPSTNGFYMPLTCLKEVVLTGFHFRCNVTASCTLTVEIRDKNRGTTYAQGSVSIAESGTADVHVPVLCRLDVSEYAILVYVSSGNIGWVSKGSSAPYPADDFLTTQGTVYWYNNSNVIFLGEILYAAGSWETAFDQQFQKKLDAGIDVDLDNIVFENPDVMVAGSWSTNGPTKDADGNITINVSSGNQWFNYTVDKTKLIDNFLIIDYDIDELTSGGARTWFFGTKTSGGTLYGSLAMHTETGHVREIVDLNYYVVYAELDLTKPITAGAGNSGVTNLVLSNFKLTTPKYDIDVDEPFYENINDMYNRIGQNETAISAMAGNEYLTSPDGSKFMLAVANDGTLSAVPTIPNKTLFIGNSLLIGNGEFGMCASAIDKDYYYYVTQAILAKKPAATFDKLAGGTFEGCTTVADAQSWMTNYLLPKLGNDVNLVIVQLGDNVNTAAKETNFATTCGMLIQYIKEYAPNARVAWAGEWYSNSNKQSIIAAACGEKGATFIDLTTVHTAGTNSYLGAVINYGTTATRNYTIDSYTDDSTNKELTVKFTVDGTQYTSVVPYTSYSVSGSTLSITGTYGFVTQGGVASHPGDTGFLAIGNLMIEKLGLN